MISLKIKNEQFGDLRNFSLRFSAFSLLYEKCK